MLSKEFLLRFFKNFLIYSGIFWGVNLSVQFLVYADPVVAYLLVMTTVVGLLSYGITKSELAREAILKNED